ncbi:MAG: hypothetical protein B9S34_13690 [Opitutia bacterium Tous-C1TDCM]|nr:MAG: hypothetical protein B9S34_13690 [Opitutae bacterium Tous-C1TDCM]
MHPWRNSLSLAVIALLCGGCGYVHVGKLPEAPAATVVGDEKLMNENAELRLEKKLLQQELALTRAQGDALRMAIENRAADGDTSKRLVEKLNETSRELASLRTSYTQLQSERNRAVASAAESATLKQQLGATEEKLAASLRNYTQLQEEIGKLRADVDRTRAENVALSEQVKSVTAQNEQAQAALAQLNLDFVAQKDARFRAEQDAATLRTELKSVAPNSSVLSQQRTGAAADARSLAAEHAAETAALKQQLDALRLQVDTLAAERTELNRRLSAAPAPDLANVEAKLATALRDATALRSENEQLKAARAQMSDQLAQLQTSGPAPSAVQALRVQLRDAQTQASVLTEENARLKARLSGAAPNPAPAVTPAPAPAPAPAAGSAPPANSGVVTIRPSGVNATLITTVQPPPRVTVGRTDSPAPAPATGGTRTHTVTGGDTLAKISTQYYGTPNRWSEILAANRDVLGESNNLVVGRTLRIP